VSSVAVAGLHRGRFTEDMLVAGQPLPSAYHRTKYESERLVRELAQVPLRVYRPAVVVGHSRTGEMDKVDGPYYLFETIRRSRDLLPRWLPLVLPDLGGTNLVPVDYVAGALDHIAHLPGLDGRTFHLVNPRPQPAVEVYNAFARAAGAPTVTAALDRRIAPPGLVLRATGLPGARQARAALLGELGIPEGVLRFAGFTATFDTADADAALAGTDLLVPALDRYAGVLWRYWERHLATDRSWERSNILRLRSLLPPRRSLRGAVAGRTVLVTGASSGIGRAAAVRIGAAGGVPLLVARSADLLAEVRAEIEAAGGTAHTYPTDLSDLAAIDKLLAAVLAEHGGVDYCVNNAGRSIRRSVAQSQDRFHDFERTVQLNYFGAIRLILGLLPAMRQRGFGHIVNVSSIGVQTAPPRFSAYVASKAALDAFTRVVSSEVVGDGITFTTIHMPLVRTPMIAPTRIYDRFPAKSPDEAADLICDALRGRPKEINTRLGTLGSVAYALAPKAVDRVLHLAYQVFPDSAAARGGTPIGEQPTVQQRVLATLLKGVHW
jgi:NAD(P)-dependent dehydrogenase (short-subunit alcohol dehydrogenase family)